MENSEKKGAYILSEGQQKIFDKILNKIAGLWIGDARQILYNVELAISTRKPGKVTVCSDYKENPNVCGTDTFVTPRYKVKPGSFFSNERNFVVDINSKDSMGRPLIAYQSSSLSDCESWIRLQEDGKLIK